MNVNFETNADTAIITINRPERRNAIDWQTAQELFAAFEQFDKDDSLNVAILTGSEGYFCAGADLQAIAEGEERPLGDIHDIGPMGPTRMTLSKPVIAAIEGHAVAGGLELALWCDLRVAAADAVLGVFCRRFGVPLVDLGTVRLPRLIGHSRAADLILTGRPVDAREALEIGLINRIASKKSALDVAIELAQQISRHPQQCMRNDRLSMLQQWGMSENEACENELKLGMQTLDSGETLSGATQFTQGSGRHGAATSSD